MIIHLVRHSRPQVPPDTCYGRLDVAAEGVEEAAERLRSLLPDGLPVWTSPLSRCRRLAESLHPAPIADERLVEMNFGAWEGRTWSDIGAAALDEWAADMVGFAPPGGESPLAMQARALAFVGSLPETEGAVLVTHAGVMRVLLAHWLALPAEEWTRMNFGYGLVTTVELGSAGGTLRCMNR